MLETNRRGTVVLYLILFAALLALIVTEAIPTTALSALLLALYGLFVLITSRNWGQMVRTLPEMTQRKAQFTENARRAAERVGFNSALYSAEFQLQDVGVVIDERRADGIMLRRSRFLSTDEESLRPYIVLYNDLQALPREVLVRFELIDASGQAQYVYEMEHFLETGENLIVADYRLRLKGNDKITQTGGWELNITVNGIAVGLHRFNLLPGMAERAKKFNDGEAPERLILEEDEALPLSLEELLANQGGGRPQRQRS
jgi:hypothetical protein